MRFFQIIFVALVVALASSQVNAETLSFGLKQVIDKSADELVMVYQDQKRTAPNRDLAIKHIARSEMYLRLYLESDCPANVVLSAAYEHSRAAIYLLQPFVAEPENKAKTVEELSYSIAKKRRMATDKSIEILSQYSNDATERLFNQAVNLFWYTEALFEAVEAQTTAEEALQQLHKPGPIQWQTIVGNLNLSVLRARRSVQVTGMAYSAYERCKDINEEVKAHIEELSKVLKQSEGNQKTIQVLKQTVNDLIDFDKKRKAKEKRAFLKQHDLNTLRVKKNLNHIAAYAMYSEPLGGLSIEIVAVKKSLDEWRKHLLQEYAN